MKNLFFTALMLCGASLPINAEIEVKEGQPSILLWLDFRVAGDDYDEDDENTGVIQTFNLNSSLIGKLYTDGQMELTFDNNEVVTVDINLNDSEVSSVEFLPTDGDRSLTFDLDDFGKGAYEVNVTMPDGSVQTATFEY